MYIKYSEWVGDNCSALGGNGYRQYQKTLYIGVGRRTYALSWVWAIDPLRQRVFTPFNGRMSYTALLWQRGYLRLHVSEKQIRKVR